MNQLVLLYVLGTLSAVGALSLIFFGFPDLADDRTRQELFGLRHRLLMSALDKNIPLDSGAYRLLRSLINGMIRYAHVFNIWNFIILALFPTTNTFSVQFDKALAELPRNHQETLKKIRTDAAMTVVMHLVRRSVLLRLLSWVYRAAHLFKPPKEMVIKMFYRAGIESLTGRAWTQVA
jgi:hypothetical protein